MTERHFTSISLLARVGSVKFVFTMLVIIALFSPVPVRGQNGDSVAIIFTGDIMLDRGVRRKINEVGIGKIFENIAPLLARADYAVVNLECPVTSVKNPQKKGFLFRAYPAWLATLAAAHITHANLANNHAIDQGILKAFVPLPTLSSQTEYSLWVAVSKVPMSAIRI